MRMDRGDTTLFFGVMSPLLYHILSDEQRLSNQGLPAPFAAPHPQDGEDRTDDPAGGNGPPDRADADKMSQKIGGRHAAE